VSAYAGHPPLARDLHPAGPPTVAEAWSTDAATDAWPHTTRALPWTLAGFLVMRLLVPFHAIVLPISLPLDATLDRFMLGGIAALWLASLLIVGGPSSPRVRLTGLHAAVGAFFCLAILSLLINNQILMNLGELQVSVKQVALLASYGLFFCLVASIVRPAEVPRFISLMVGLAAILAIMTNLEYRLEVNPFYDWTSAFLGTIVQVPPDLHTIDYSGRTTVYASMEHPLELALVLNLAVPFALVSVLEATERSKRMKRLALTGLLFAGIFATQRKTGLIASAASVAVLLAYRPRALRQMLPILLGLIVILHVLAPGAIGNLRQQLQPDRLTGTNSTQQRSNDYDAVAPDIRSHPALGRGYGSYDHLKYRILDNQYLGLLVTVGIVGTASYILMLLAGMVSAHRARKRAKAVPPPLMAAASGAIASFIVGSALFDVLSFAHVTYMVMFILGLIVAAQHPERDEDPALAW
jgi:O-antigen ligase